MPHQDLPSKIEKKMKQLGDDYTPRTRHMKEDGSPRFTNRLFLEQSPYLLQHAHNPVNWYPWGDEAFEEAQKSNRPILVSIGYATCHWCHVMEEESFEDLDIAEILNTHFVPIKVDREERPDIDGIYMSAVQMLTGGGGWPLNAFLLPDGRPFFGGTYFPARDGDRPPNPGFETLLKRISDLYKNQNATLEEQATRLTEALSALGQRHAKESAPPDKTWVEQAIAGLGALYDPVNGGSKGAPKFPATLPVGLFLSYARRNDNEAMRQMAVHSLKAMADGGIHDQIGGGFHRYSTDARWLVPHFEKMLYDNALLASLYLDGFLETGEPRFKEVCIKTLDYMSREMQAKGGGFVSATDADSPTPSGHKEEGYFFTWSLEEIKEALPEGRWTPVLELYQLMGAPHFEGRYIPHRIKTLEEIAKTHGLIPTTLTTLCQEANCLLYAARQKRKAPLTDTKIIAAWNGLVLSAFARAGKHLDQKRDLDIARNTATFILEHLMKDGRLHRNRLDEIGPKGFLEDYAFVVQGLLDLYDATQEETWLEHATHLTHDMVRLFSAEDGGFYMTANDTPPLVAKERPGHDGATPSPNGIAAMNLFRLYHLTQNPDYLATAMGTVSAFLSPQTNPVPYTGILAALDFHLNKS